MAKKEWQVCTKNESGASGWAKHVCRESALKQIYEIMRDSSVMSKITLYSVDEDGFVSTELTVTFDN